MRDLSLRYKIPLRATILMLVTALALTAAILTREYEELRKELFINAEALGRVLSETLIAPLRHDDLWRAYEIIKAPMAVDGPGADLLLLVNPEMEVLVSTRPEQVRMLSPLAGQGVEFSRVAVRLLDAPFAELSAEGASAGALKMVEPEHYYLALPVVADGVIFGTLVMRYPRDIHGPRFVGILERAATVTVLVLAILLPLSWYWGRRMAEPLINLAQCMKKVGQRLPDEPDCRLYESRDELGQLSTQLRDMIGELNEKQALERQVMVSERLAAVGRLAAGIAHEVNNPLGGMLNAINTHKRHGQSDPRTDRTLALLERGLTQIRDTVSALLVEARPGQTALTPADIDDVRRLVLSGIEKKNARLDWNIDVREALPLPATLVRQILINLLLNASRAAHDQVCCRLAVEADVLTLEVCNDGAHIPPERMSNLFEPYASGEDRMERSAGHGMGLWMTYQIVSQLKGRINVRSEPGWTCFAVRLPLAPQSSIPRIEDA